MKTLIIMVVFALVFVGLVGFIQTAIDKWKNR